MHVSVLVNSNRPWDEVVQVAQTLDEAGVHAVYVPDHFKGSVLDERCREVGREPSEIKRASGFFVDDLSDGAATVAAWDGVCEEFVFGDVGHPADQLIDAVVTAIG